MSDIFISYSSADRDRARVLAAALTERGWTVWWDRTIPPGKEFDEVIEEALDASQCVVVLWSNTSVASTWVKTEAAEAMRRKILIPALIDAVKIPLEFRRLQAADLSNWKGERSHEELQKFFQSIEANVGHSGAEQPAPERASPEPAPQRAEAPQQPPPVARTEAPAPRARSSAWTMGIAAIVALVVVVAGYTAYNEHAKRVALEEKAEKERRAAEEARRVAGEAATRARAAQEEAARQAAQRKMEEQRRAVEDAARAARERVERERLAREKAERERVEQERVARERAERLAEKQRQQKAAAGPSSLRLAWHDHALRFTGILTGSAGAGMLRATIWDLRTGQRIGNYDVPVTIVKQGPSDYVVSGNFAIPGDSVTPTPHTHTSRLHLRSEQDGAVRLIQNCPQPGQCYAAK